MWARRAESSSVRPLRIRATDLEVVRRTERLRSVSKCGEAYATERGTITSFDPSHLHAFESVARTDTCAAPNSELSAGRALPAAPPAADSLSCSAWTPGESGSSMTRWCGSRPRSPHVGHMPRRGGGPPRGPPPQPTTHHPRASPAPSSPRRRGGAVRGHLQRPAGATARQLRPGYKRSRPSSSSWRLPPGAGATTSRRSGRRSPRHRPDPTSGRPRRRH